MNSGVIDSSAKDDADDKDKVISLRQPVADDGFAVSELIKRCPPLDTNSTYCNLLQCDHFSGTSVIAQMGDETVGFVSGYVLPDNPEVLFVWQVAVDERARGHGLASRMVHHIVKRDGLREVKWIETTITPGNDASANLFKRLAKDLSAPLNTQPKFNRATHFGGHHDDEILHRVGPFGDLST